MTLADLKKRHSVRNYTSHPIEISTVNKLKSEATFINSHEAGLNFQPCFSDPAPFRGFLTSYGSFTGVENYLAAVIDPTFPDAYERAGYCGELFALKAVQLGLGTCFVGVTFDRNRVGARMEVYEKMPFVITFGHEAPKKSMVAKLTSKIAHRKEMSPREFFQGSDEDYAEASALFPWLDDALQAVRCAPSALNKRPVRLILERNGDTPAIGAITIDPAKYAVELGIAKANVASVVPGEWEWGENGKFIAQSNN